MIEVILITTTMIVITRIMATITETKMKSS